MLFLVAGMMLRARILQTQPEDKSALAQPHLLWMVAALIAMAGLVVSFPLRKELSGSKVFVIGVIISFASTVWGIVLCR